MIPCRISNATRYLGAPAGWQPEDDGPCGHLAIADITNDHGHNTMVSMWEPTPAELALLNAGAKVSLSIIGTAHPPVWVWVQPPEA